MANSAERESAISILRACLLSNKGGIALSILNRDYKSLVGDYIPYRKLGYSGVEEFLRSINDILVCPGPNGEPIVKARPSEASAHIASLVNRQKTSQKKRPPIPNYCQSRKPANHSWKPPPSSHKPAPPSSQKPAPLSSHKPSSRSSRLSVTVNNVHEKPSRLVTLRSNSAADENRHKYEIPPRLQKLKDDPDRFSNNLVQSQYEDHENEDLNNLPLNFEENCAFDPDAETIYDEEYSGYQSGFCEKSRKSILSPFSPRNAIAAGRAKTQAIAAKELEDKYTSQYNHPDEVIEEQFYDYNMEVAPWNRTKPGVGQMTAASYEDTYVSKLRKYSAQKGLPEPSYKIIPRHPKNGGPLYGCQVKVEGQYFSSYPDESYIKEEAKEFAAKKAYQKLIQNDEESHLNGFKVTSDVKIMHKRIYKLVEKHPAGLWADSIAALYSNDFKELLPKDWVNKASSFPQLSVNKVCEGKVIISPNSSPSLEETDPFQLLMPSKKLTPDISKPVPIHTQVLPSSEFWDVYVTYVAPTGEVWLRIIGASYSEQYENMACEMELFYVNNMHKLTSPPRHLKVDEFYAARLIDEYSSGDNWHRVCIQDIDWNAKTADCWLIDNGDSDTLAFSQIYDLSENFKYLPRQAVLCSLAGLEDFVIDEIYVGAMVRELVGKVLVAKIVYRNDTDNEYSLVLYDTNGDDDLNMNEELIKLIDLETSKPELPEEQGVKEVYVSHISDDGQLYVQIQSNIFTHLESLIEDLSADTIIEHCLKSSRQLETDKFYLAKYDLDERWYRVVVPVAPSATSRSVEVQFIDYGNTSMVDISNISDLEAISDVLSRIPKQALLVSLHGMADISPTECAKLKEMITDSDPVLLKVISAGDVPQVEVFKRTTVPEGGVLISINNTISVERDLARSSQPQRRPSTRRSRSSSRPVTPSVSRPVSPVVPFDTVHCSLSPPVIPVVVSDFFDVFVTLAAHPHNFIVQPLNNINSLKQLIGKMKEFYSEDSESNRVSNDNLVEGGLYAALFDNDQWYRVTLTALMNNCMSVYSCDFGEYTVVSSDKLRYLAPQFTELPYQGIKAKLTGILPLHGDWTAEDCVRFQELVVDKQLVSIIMEKGPDVLNPNVTVLGLQLIDTSTDEDVVISHVLISEKRALRVVPQEERSN